MIRIVSYVTRSSYILNVATTLALSGMVIVGNMDHWQQSMA